MALTKKFLKSKPVCKVTFKIPAEDARDSEKAFIVGEFNGWDTAAAPMKRNKDGSFSATLDLDTGKDYQFRYFLDSLQWINDPDADRYEFSGFGDCDNSVVSL